MSKNLDHKIILTIEMRVEEEWLVHAAQSQFCQEIRNALEDRDLGKVRKVSIKKWNAIRTLYNKVFISGRW